MAEEWYRAVKKPVEVQYRLVNGEREEIHTLEGKLVAERGKHLIIKGVKGELYPIDIKIFMETYDLVTCPFDDVAAKRHPRGGKP